MSAPGLFVDRDGTIIRDVGYPSDPAAVELLGGSAAGLRAASAIGFKLVIVSNQSGVARGFFDEGAARRVALRVAELFAVHGVCFDGAYYCFHGPDDGCSCRKPKPGMLLRAAEELDLDLGRSLMIGDKESDVEAGRAAGCATIAFGGLSCAATGLCASWADVELWLADNAKL
jgi:D-glycero-D-manno-heptose 1,7-bisphosphate phosphatase